jgi:hypothetical protein
MSYTTVDNVCAMFPTFTRNGAKGPSDTQIQFWINDIASDIRAILQRRFYEAYSTVGFTAWEASLNPDQICILEKINRYGTCSQLATVFETAGIASAARVAKSFEDSYDEEFNKLNARTKDGKPMLQGGDYDVLFDSQAKVETPRAQLGGVSGGDQRPGMKDSENSSNVFKKWDRREF